MKYIKKDTFIPYLVNCIGDEKYKQCAYLIGQAKNIVILTGAGISTYSGIPDFTSTSGLYKNKISSSFFTLDYFKNNPDNFYETLHEIFKNKSTNKAHNLLSILTEKYPDKKVIIITQNIDNLHEESGFKDTIHVHGTLNKGYCLNCKKEVYPFNIEHYRCDCIADFKKYSCETVHGLIRPDIVFYGEDIQRQEEALNLIKKADLLLIIGTSLTVEPVASFPKSVKVDTPIIIINRDITYLNEDRMSIEFNSDIISTLESIFKELK